MSRLVALFATLLGLALPQMAAAQTLDHELPAPPSTYLHAPTEESAEAYPAPTSRWPEPPGSLSVDVRHPLAASEPDDGIVLNGLGLFIGAYVTGLLLTTPFMAFGSGEAAFGGFGFVPLAQWAVGFYDTSGWGPGATMFSTGAVFGFWQLIGAIVVFSGLAHHRDLLRPGAVAGDVSFSRGGFEVAF